VTITDNSGETITPTVDLSGVDFTKEGDYIAKVSATDAAGNTTTVDVAVKVTADVTPPVISGNTEVTYPAGRSVSPSELFADANITVKDNSGTPITPSVDLSGVDFNTPGKYVVSVHAQDASGNEATPFELTITITSEDKVAPVITADDSLRYYINRPVTPEQFIKDAHIVVTDNSGETIVPVIDLSGVDFNTVGTYTVTVNAKDSAGNEATPVTISVSVRPAPILQIKMDHAALTYEVGTELTEERIVDDANIFIVYNNDLTITSNVDLSAVNASELGNYPVGVTADDSYGNHASAVVSVNIVDTTAPVITGNTKVEYGLWGSATNEEFLTDAGITVTDNYDKNITPRVDLANVDFTKVGTYTVTVAATDSSGNEATPYEVTIEVIGLNITIANRTLTYEAGTILDTKKIIADAGIQVITSQNKQVEVEPTVDFSTLNARRVGTYRVTVFGKLDIGRDMITDADELTITIIDTTIPEINFGYNPNEPITYSLASLITPEDIIRDAKITVSDNSDDEITPQVDLASLDPTVAGTYTVGITAEDSQGNQAAAASLPITISAGTTDPGTGNKTDNKGGPHVDLHASNGKGDGHLTTTGQNSVFYQYIVGALLIIGGAVVLIVKRKKSNK